MKQRITVLGAGRMGSALVLAFLKHGHEVTVWNRTASRCRPLEAKGARVATSVVDAVSHAEIVVGNVSDYLTSADVLRTDGVTSALRERLFVQLATGTPRQGREMAAWAREHRMAYLDGAIMATPNVIGEAGCTVLYSGAPEVFEANRAVFAALGGNAVHVGADAGHANALDGALLIVLWGSVFGAVHGAAICEAEGFPLDVFAASVGATMPVIEGSLKDVIERIRTRRFAADETTMATAEICHASVRLIHDMSKERGLHLGLTEALDVVFRRANADHSSDLAAVYASMKA